MLFDGYKILLSATGIAIGCLSASTQQAVGTSFGVTTGTPPVVGVTLGTSSYGSYAGGWGNVAGYNPIAGMGGGYFPTATNALIGVGGYDALPTSPSVAPPPYSFGSSGSFNSTGAGELGLSGLVAGAQAAQIAKYSVNPPLPPEVVYDFAQSSSTYAGLTAKTSPPPPSPPPPDMYTIGAGIHPGYAIAPISTPTNVTGSNSAYANLQAFVSPSIAGVTWLQASSGTGMTVATGKEPAIVSTSTGAISATNNAAIGQAGRTMLAWGASGSIPLAGSFIEFGLNGNITAGPAAAIGPIGAGPIVFAISTMGNRGLQGLLTTGQTGSQITVSLTSGPAFSSKTFANGDFIAEGYSITNGSTKWGFVGYNFNFWAVSLSSTFTLGSGADLAGTATATMFGNEGTSLELNPSQLPPAYAMDPTGFTYLTVPEPVPAVLLATSGLGLLLVRRRYTRS